jgi:putative oxidoreductase
MANGRGGGEPGANDLALLVLRMFTGLAMALAHGIGKVPPKEGFVNGVGELGFPAPLLFAWAAGLAEFAGGLLLAAGLFTRPAALMILMTMLVAAFRRHAADPFDVKEKALLYAAVAFFFLIAGGGRLALDAWRGRRRS